MLKWSLSSGLGTFVNVSIYGKKKSTKEEDIALSLAGVIIR